VTNFAGLPDQTWRRVREHHFAIGHYARGLLYLSVLADELPAGRTRARPATHLAVLSLGKPSATPKAGPLLDGLVTINPSSTDARKPRRYSSGLSITTE
jgi:hypothetical protein